MDNSVLELQQMKIVSKSLRIYTQKQFENMCLNNNYISYLSVEVPPTCSAFANCEFNNNHYKYECVCSSGYDGNGIDCIEIEVSCKDEDICDLNADCNYNVTLRRNICECHAGYEGNGRSCQLANECQSAADCGYHSTCDNGLCVCQNGYERDSSDL